MSIRGFSPIVGIQPKPPKAPPPARPPKSVRTHSEKKFTPKINKSFTCYNDAPAQSNQSFTADKSRNISYTHLKSRNKSLNKYRNFRSIPKLLQKESIKKDSSVLLLEKAHFDMKEFNFKSAISNLNKVIKEESNNPAALYARGKCYISLQSYKEAIPDLLSLVQDFPLYEKNAYIALAMSFVAVDDYQTAIRQLSKAVVKFPKFKDAYLARGQLLTHQKIWDKAISDYYKVISLSPEDGNAYLGLSDALIAMGDISNALKVLNSAAKCKNISNQAYIKRGKILYESNNFKKALKELNKAIKVAPLDPESYYYKALIQLNMDNLTEAALCLEQVVKYDSSKKFSGAAIYDLGAIKIKQKDYYGAMHTFQRATDTNVEIKQQKVLVNYVEAILTLMKRKFKEGTVLLSKLIKKNNPLIQEYIGNCYTFRGYAYAAQEIHEKAVKDLSVASKLQKLDSASEYNFYISQAILLADKKVEHSLTLFNKAKELYNKNPEPYIYQAYLYLSQKDCDKAIFELTAALGLKQGDSELHFFRGIVYYYLMKYEDCIKELDVAIEKAEDNNPFHYLCRGMCYANLGYYEEGVNDFSAVIQLNDSMAQAYLYRGRCSFLRDDTNFAYADFQKVIYALPEDPMVHMYAGDLLLLTNSIEDALKAYNNSLSKHKTKQVHIRKMKCYFLLGNLKCALDETKEALALDNDKKLLQDFNTLKAIELFESGNYKEAIKSFQEFSADGLVICWREIKKFIAISYFYAEEYTLTQTVYQNLLDSQDTDTVEIVYNLALSNIFSEFYEAAITQLNELAYMVDGTDRGKLLFLVGYIHLGLENESDGREYIEEAYKFDRDTVSTFLKQSSKVSILPLNSSSPFSQKFPLKSIKLGRAYPIHVRPSFSLPLIEMPKLDFPFEECIFSQFKLKNIKCKPEAPWLNRVQGMIQFTDEVQEIVSETITESVAEDVEEDENEEDEEGVFDEGIENFKKYRSALCLPRGNSAELLRNMKEVFENNE